MYRTVNALLLGLVVLEVLAFLLPTTLVYVAGQLWSLYFTLANGTEHFNPGSPRFNLAWVGLTVVLLIIGYALFSVWWLVLRFRTKTIKEVPKYIWVGISVGMLAALFLSSPFSWTPPTKFISFTDMLKTKAIFGGGPLILVLTLLGAMHFRAKNLPP